MSIGGCDHHAPELPESKQEQAENLPEDIQNKLDELDHEAMEIRAHYDYYYGSKTTEMLFRAQDDQRLAQINSQQELLRMQGRSVLLEQGRLSIQEAAQLYESLAYMDYEKGEEDAALEKFKQALLLGGPRTRREVATALAFRAFNKRDVHATSFFLDLARSAVDSLKDSEEKITRLHELDQIRIDILPDTVKIDSNKVQEVSNLWCLTPADCEKAKKEYKSRQYDKKSMTVPDSALQHSHNLQRVKSVGKNTTQRGFSKSSFGKTGYT